MMQLSVSSHPLEKGFLLQEDIILICRVKCKGKDEGGGGWHGLGVRQELPEGVRSITSELQGKKEAERRTNGM